MDSMVWAARGVRGVVTNGGTRDTDEVLVQKAMPVWSRWIVQPMYQGRVEYGGDSMPVVIGGQRIDPGDLIVADGDGVIVVPIEVVDEVLKYAIQESENDKKARAALYKVPGHSRRREHALALRRARPPLRLERGEDPLDVQPVMSEG